MHYRRLTRLEVRVLSTMRKTVVAAGVAALLSSQAVFASPAKTAPGVDPLVALSLLGTSQSRAAVCASGAACGLPVAAGAPAASSPAVATAASAAAVQGEPRRENRGIPMLLLLGGGMILIAVLVAALAGNQDSDVPISPD